MKILIVNSIMLAVTAMAGTRLNPASDLFKDELSGKVKACTTTTYRIVPGAILLQTKMLLNKTKVVYNANGNRAEILTFNRQGQLTRDRKFDYDEHGKLIIKDDNNAALIGKTATTKDKNGITTQTTTYPMGNVMIKKTNSKGLVLETLMNNAKGVTTAKAEYKYNAQGYKSFEDDFGPGLKLIHTMMYKYNEAGKNTETTYYKPDGEMLSKITITYNDKGFQTGRSMFTAATNITHSWKNEFGKTDSHGNWLATSEFYDGKLVEVKEREIEY